MGPGPSPVDVQLRFPIGAPRGGPCPASLLDFPGEVWTEHDHARPEAPSYFFGLAAGPAPAARHALLAQAWGGLSPLPPPDMGALTAAGGHVGFLGLMCSREPVTARVQLKGLFPHGVAPALGRIGWPGDPARADLEVSAWQGLAVWAAALLELCWSPGGWRLTPRLDLELVPPPGGWPALLERGRERGLVCPARAREVLAWPGRSTPAARPWPAALAVAALRRPDQEVCLARTLSHLKVTLGAPEAKAYLAFGPRQVPRGGRGPLEVSPRRAGRPAPARGSFRARAREYWDAHTPDYLRALGPTFQAGFLDEVPFESNRRFGLRAGLEPGMRILDAGCGVAGPALDLARAFPGLEIEGVTCSAVQEAEAARRIRMAGLAGRVRVCQADFHRLPFPDGLFQAVIYLESTGYSDDLPGLFGEAVRVLAPGGILYLKDWFRREGPLGARARADLEEFDEIYRTRTVTPAAIRAALEGAGFPAPQIVALDPLLRPRPWRRAMEDLVFARLHERPFVHLPVGCAEARVRRPA